jgi:DNA-directed RNA polymerase II subunit RPB2
MNVSDNEEVIRFLKDLNKELLRVYLRDHDLVGHNLDSFDQGIDEIVKYLENKEWVQVSKDSPDVMYRIVMSDCRLLFPTVHNAELYEDIEIFPHECIERRMSYEGKLRVTVEVIIERSLEQRFRESPGKVDVDLMYIPIPVGSRYCNTSRHHEYNSTHPSVFKLRGCFIVKGQKKNIICFETASTNLPVFMHKNDIGYFYEIRSQSRVVTPGDAPFDITLTVYPNVIRMKKYVLLFQSRSFKMYNKTTKAITLVSVLAALGLTTFEEIRDALLGPNPSYDLEQAMAVTLSNPDDFPLPPTHDLILEKFGSAPTTLGSHLGRKSNGSNEPPTIRTERHRPWVDLILEREILPHCGKDYSAKIIILCQMARRVALANYANDRGIPVSIDNRDDLCNKYMKGYADLMQEIVLESLKVIREKVYKEIRKNEKSQRNQNTPLSRATFPNIVGLPWTNFDVTKTIANGTIQNRTRGKVKSVTKKGLTQNFGGLNLMYDLSCLRNFKNPINSQSKCESIRQIQPSSFGYYCPTETREGQEVGLDHALALQATTSLVGNVDEIITVIQGYHNDQFEPLASYDTDEYCMVNINGKPFCMISVDHMEDFAEYMRAARRASKLHEHVSITVGSAFDYGESLNEVHIRYNAGRLTAAYLIMDPENMKPYILARYFVLMSIREELDPNDGFEVEEYNKLNSMVFDDFLRPLTIYFRDDVYEFPAAVEYIDVFERKNVVISEFLHDTPLPGTTHCMIHPSLMLGSSAAEVPFPDHNQSPRNSYQCGMGKQSIAGRPLTDIIDSQIQPYLLYPQNQLVQTEFTRMILNKHPCPAGFNGVVAIMSYLSNQEDAIVVNRDSIQRGMGVSMHFGVFSDCALNTGLQYESGLTQADRFAFPDPDKVCKGFTLNKRFDHIDENGVAIVGSVIVDGDPLICKLRKFQTTRHECIKTTMNGYCNCEYANSITCYHGNDTAIVDNVQVTTNAAGDTLVNVVVRYIRTPAVGDKLASRHGQKGTIGRVVSREDLPFNQDGISPDIIINPHAIPSRMTVAHLIETLAGMFTCVSGEFVDATCFGEDSRERWTVRNLAKELRKYGYSENCENVMTCGMSGKLIEGTVFMGPIFYQRMKQMPIDKAHARAIGQVTTSTRQPQEGRSKKGGFRAGEMERDCLTSHGASAVIQERFMHSSDPYNIYVCDECGRPCVGNDNEHKRIFKCFTCGNVDPTRMSIVQMPYAGKLLHQEIMGLRVGIDIITENNKLMKDAC